MMGAHETRAVLARLNDANAVPVEEFDGGAEIAKRRRSPNESFRWHLAMKYHQDPYPGHSTGRADTCHECSQIEALVSDWQGAVLDSLARPS